jgi:transposase InsO family protein
MTSIIRKYCRKCETCIKNKSRRCKPAGKLGFLGPAVSPFQIMSLDTVGGFAGFGSTKRYLHILVDHFSRFAFTFSSNGQSARDMIKLIDSVQSRHQIGTLLTDQYGGLNSDEFYTYCHNHNIQHIFTAVDSAFSNGLNERLNQTLVNRIRCLKNDSSSPVSPWPKIASQCVSQYNDTPHSVTSFPPRYLLDGTKSDLFPSLLDTSSNLSADRELALRNTIHSHNYNKSRYDKKVSDVSFAVGDYVYVNNGSKLNRPKLDPIRLGPFLISRKLSNSVYEIDVKTGNFSKRLYHVSKMIKCAM